MKAMKESKMKVGPVLTGSIWCRLSCFKGGSRQVVKARVRA